MNDPNKAGSSTDPTTEKVVADEVSFRARALELEMRERVDNNTRERLDATANFVGIVAAVVFGVFGLGTYLLVQNLVRSEVEAQMRVNASDLQTRVDQSIELQSLRISDSVGNQLDVMRRELETTVASLEATARELELTAAALEAERSLALLLPLVVGEAIDIDADDEETLGDVLTYSEELVIASMAQIAPALEQLDGFTFDLAMRRIERILDVFWERGRYHEMHETLTSMSPELLERLLGHETQGVLYTVSDGLASELLIEGSLPPSRALILQLVQRQSVRPTDYAAEPMEMLDIFLEAEARGWTSETVRNRLVEAADQMPLFAELLLHNQVCYIASNLPADPSEFTIREANLEARLSAISSAFSEAPINQACAAFEYEDSSQ